MPKARLLVLLLFNETLTTGKTVYKEQKRKRNQVVCSWKGEQRDPKSSVCPSCGSPAQTPSPCPQLCIPVASLLPPQRGVSQNKQLIQQKITSAKTNIQMVKKKAESASWPVCKCWYQHRRGVGLHSWRSTLGWDEKTKIFLRGSLALNRLKLI